MSKAGIILQQWQVRWLKVLPCGVKEEFHMSYNWKLNVRGRPLSAIAWDGTEWSQGRYEGVVAAGLFDRVDLSMASHGGCSASQCIDDCNMHERKRTRYLCPSSSHTHSELLPRAVSSIYRTASQIMIGPFVADVMRSLSDRTLQTRT